MFLGQKKMDTTKGLGSIKIDSFSAPTHCTPSDLLPASLKYRPASSAPTRGATELTRETRHSNHLRKKRVLKKEKKSKDELMRGLAQNNKKLRSRMEKEDALKKLGKNRNVQIIGGSNKKGGSDKVMKRGGSDKRSHSNVRK